MAGRLLGALLRVVLALTVLKALVDLLRDGHGALALLALILPISVAIVVRVRSPGRRTAAFAGATDQPCSAVFRQLSLSDQTRIASLAASGNAIGAIMALRKLTKIDLRTAKDVVDQLTAPGRNVER